MYLILQVCKQVSRHDTKSDALDAGTNAEPLQITIIPPPPHFLP